MYQVHGTAVRWRGGPSLGSFDLAKSVLRKNVLSPIKVNHRTSSRKKFKNKNNQPTTNPSLARSHPMVQYVFTPWRNRRELLRVRRQLYPPASFSSSSSSYSTTTSTTRRQHQQDDDERAEKQKAVARVSMWVQRGNCPHMVESSALLMAA